MHGCICGRVRFFLRGVAGSAPVVLAALCLPVAASLATAAYAAEPARLGKTTVGASKEGFAAERKQVDGYRLPVAGKVSQLSVYLEPAAVIGQQEIEGVLYSEGLQGPEELLNVSFPIAFASGQAAGWYTLSFPIASELAPGSYWLGVVTSGPAGVAAYRYDTVGGAGAYNANAFAFGPTNPFGLSIRDSQQISLYATYTPQSGATVPENTSVPTIAGAAAKGQQLSASAGSWSGSPTAYSYAWQRCNPTGAACNAITGATSASYPLGEADVGSTLRVAVTASNEAGTSVPVSSAPTAVVGAGTQLPASTSPPTISGSPQQGATLTEAHGTWSGKPTSFSIQWMQCNSLGQACLAIAKATGSTYTLTPGDVGHEIAVQETAGNSAGAGAPAASAPTAVVLPLAPTSTAPPTISGSPQQGATLTEAHGTWSGEPTSYSIQWMQCEASGSGCQAISGAAGQTYVPTSSDVGHTIRVSETATNAGGSSSAATSAPTATIVAPGTTATFGTTTVGTLHDGGMFANYKIVHRATLSAPGAVTKLTLYAVPGIHATAAQSLRALIYADSGGSPGALLAAGPEVVYRGNVNGSGWFELPLSAPVSLSPGTYWIGFITSSETEGMGYAFASVAGSRAYNTNTFSSGPTNPFGTASKDAELASIYATYTPATVPVPHNTSPPTISGTAQQGQQLSASTGTWSGSPTSYEYEWLRCNSAGASCSAIAGAASATYTLGEADVGSTLRVAVSAGNEGGESEPATSAQTAVVGGSVEPTQHLEYVLQDGSISVYDMDHEFKLLKTISMPPTKTAQVRGVSVAPSLHLMFIMYGGDGPINSSGNGSVLAYDLVGEKVVWEKHLSTGGDSGQVSPDGSKLYVPSGENTTSGIWNVLSTATGEVIGTIQGGSGAHNTVASDDGSYVYLGGRLYNYLDVYETATGKVKEIGPLVGEVRPFTVNGSNTLAFTTATGFDGFQVSSITTGKVLWTVSFSEAKGVAVTAPSHGVALSPSEQELYVVDYVHKDVQFWNVAGAGEGVAPTQIGVVPLSGLTGEATGCLYDCERSGWLQLSSDGRYVFVGDSGEVIETATRKVVTTLPTLAQTKMSIEIDWQGGVPVDTSGRTGVGKVG
ncbi:MAG TPA: hypothetical protein VGX51_02745 [Solirubrobacteraceae bacterium]|nr:hypothetical protein [Solirubrobacteraceae bacterium]